jgi:hypothetical protein
VAKDRRWLSETAIHRPEQESDLDAPGGSDVQPHPNRQPGPPSSHDRDMNDRPTRRHAAPTTTAPHRIGGYTITADIDVPTPPTLSPNEPHVTPKVAISAPC